MNKQALASRMRLAYTRATVAFPRTLNALPISNEVYRIFEEVYTDLASSGEKVQCTFEPLDERIIGAMSAMVYRATEEIKCSAVAKQVTNGMPAPMAKQFSGLVAGMDRTSAVDFIAYARGQKRTAEEIRAKRSSVLMARRNVLANKFVNDCIRGARTYFLSEVPDA